ncbi:hypothetical protein L227DRAFT_581963 [Lentinus tigrinus ALCF2SS1-6]|uniref:Uncharacterized protein n=1 Tax=Lentinus tigrinus ALCF2SS1-6 TaxID=1328759 RepID=A0A5C2RQK1_9APHY|nr:hypothetical protein L227DRAFT_581963 [Lentinus tigrinus ALCF2SS1-6]
MVFFISVWCFAPSRLNSWTSINMVATHPDHSSLRPRTRVLPSRPRVPSSRHLSLTSEPLRLLCPDLTAEQARRHPMRETIALYVDSQGVSHPSLLLSTGACVFDSIHVSLLYVLVVDLHRYKGVDAGARAVSLKH